MQNIRWVTIGEKEIPVLISDEREALLAAKAAGRAIIGLWEQGQEMEQISAADYVTEDMESVTEEFLERVVRRHLGMPWNICETERLRIREICVDDFEEIQDRNIGPGFEAREELMAYIKNQYGFYEFGLWAVIEKLSGNLVGAAGLKIPLEEGQDQNYDVFALPVPGGCAEVTLELGYHIFEEYRCRGYAKECCQAILQYGIEELDAAVLKCGLQRVMKFQEIWLESLVS